MVVAQREWEGFKTLKSLSKASGLEEHGITVDYDVFEDLQKPIHALERGLPSPVYHAVDLNFKLNPDGKAVERRSCNSQRE